MMRSVALATLPAFLIGVLFVTAAGATEEFPRGSYEQTCVGLEMHADTLRAVCRTRDGKWLTAQLSRAGACPGNISNEDGHLTCNKSTGPDRVSDMSRPQLGHASWGLKEGAPDQINAVAQTADGYLWLGSATGLFRFDGLRFERFRPAAGTQLLSNNISALLAPPSGGLWIGYLFGGFSFLNEGRLTHYRGEPPSGTVTGFAKSPDGVVWAGTSSGVWKLEHGQFKRLGPESQAPSGIINQIAFDRAGFLWIKSAKTILFLRPAASRFEVAEPDISVLGIQSTGFTVDHEGFVVTGESWRPVGVPSGAGPPSYPVLAAKGRVLIDQAGALWILDATITHQWPEGSLEDAVRKGIGPSVQADDYEIVVLPGSCLVDREGNIWLGGAKGLDRFYYKPFVHAQVPFLNGEVGIATDAFGGVWGGARLCLFFNVRNANADPRQSVATLGVNVVYRSPDGTRWIGTASGLWRETSANFQPVRSPVGWSEDRDALGAASGHEWIQITPPKEVADQIYFLQAITQDRQGGLWMSLGRHGLYRVADGIWASKGGRPDLPSAGVISEFTDSLGRVWLGYVGNQIAVLDGDRLLMLGPDDGLQVGNVLALAGRGPDVWIGGEFGLQRFSQGRLQTVHAVDDEMLRGISGIIERTNGDLWLNDLSGVFHIDHAEIARALSDPTVPVTGEHFGVREGLPGLATQLRPVPSAVEATDGRLWFAVANGVVFLDPDRAQHPVPPLPVTIEAVLADDRAYELRTPLTFPPHTSIVQMTFVSVSLSAPEAVRYRYRLDEADSSWREVRTPMPVNYRDLPPGTYHFHVEASNTNGSWSGQEATLAFSVLPAFYQTAWFRAVLVVTTLGLLWAAYQFRLRQLASAFEVRLQERLDERTRIARELHDTLLQSFQGLLLRFQAATHLLPDRPADAKQQFERAIDSASDAIAEGRDAVQNLRASTVVTNDLAAAIAALGRELTATWVDDAGASPPALEITVEGTSRDLNPIVRDDVYRIAAEAIRNAFRHARARRIDVHIRYDDRTFELQVRDDGVGMDRARVDEQRPGHFGLAGMRERAERVGGHLDVSSEAGLGTRIELSIPTAVAFAERRRPKRS